MNVETIVRLPPEDSGVQHSIIRLHNCRIDRKRLDKARFFRREPLIIHNLESGVKVLRYAMGHGTTSVRKCEIALDYDAVDALGVKYKTPVEVQVRRASIFEVYRWYWRHPSLSVQLSIRLGVTGAALGLLGFTTGLIGLLPLLVG